MKLLNDDQNSSMFGYFSPQQGSRKNLDVDILAGLKHPNLMKSIHSYRGTTERFRRFLTVIVPQPRGCMNSIEIPKQALFIVTEHYSHTLESFITAQRGVAPAPLYGLSNEFFQSLLYQIISGILYLRRFGIVHRNVHSGSIYMSERFCPIIGNFELAVRVFDNDNKKVALTDACQISAGNSNAWSPELLLSKTREHQLVAQNVSVYQMKKYEKYLFMFFSYALYMYISLRLRFCLTFWEEANSIVCDRVALAISIVFSKWEREADLFLKILAYKNTQNT